MNFFLFVHFILTNLQNDQNYLTEISRVNEVYKKLFRMLFLIFKNRNTCKQHH